MAFSPLQRTMYTMMIFAVDELPWSKQDYTCKVPCKLCTSTTKLQIITNYSYIHVGKVANQKGAFAIQFIQQDMDVLLSGSKSTLK